MGKPELSMNQMDVENPGLQFTGLTRCLFTHCGHEGLMKSKLKDCNTTQRQH